jgi:hypothetical protein
MISFDIEEPSDDFKPLLHSGLSRYVSSFMLIASSYEPELSLYANRNIKPGPFPLRVRVSNPGALNLSAEVRIPLRSFKLLGVTFITIGEQRVVRDELVWYLKLPPKGRADAQFILVPAAEGEIREEAILRYEIAGKVGELRKEIEVVVERIERNSSKGIDSSGVSGNSTRTFSEASKIPERANETSISEETLSNSFNLSKSSDRSNSPEIPRETVQGSGYSVGCILIALAVAALIISALLLESLRHS